MLEQFPRRRVEVLGVGVNAIHIDDAVNALEG